MSSELKAILKHSGVIVHFDPSRNQMVAYIAPGCGMKHDSAVAGNIQTVLHKTFETRFPDVESNKGVVGTGDNAVIFFRFDLPEGKTPEAFSREITAAMQAVTGKESVPYLGVATEANYAAHMQRLIEESKDGCTGIATGSIHATAPGGTVVPKDIPER